MKVDLQNLQEYREDNRLEAKLAQKGLPASLWETYSAFANTDGGLILLGVREYEDHKLMIMGVNDAERLVADFWNTINNTQKISVNVLTNQCVQVIVVDGKKIIAIDVPRADRTMKPVYIGPDPMKGSYRRNGEGDYHCNKDQVAAMYRDASDVGADMRVLANMDKEVLDMESVHAYRNRFASFHPNHVWLNLDDDLFMRRIGAMSLSDEDKKPHPTVAGLLMFGYEYEILREFPNYFLDYQERLDDNKRWSNRIVSSSGEWSGNLFDFFFKVFPRLTDGLPRPFVMRESSRIDETPLHDALREMLLNALVHADHYGRQGIVVIKAKDFYSFSNPGDIRIGLNVALSGGVSDSRNSVIMKMFALIDKVERAGMGIPQAINSWQELLRVTPYYQVTYNPERTMVKLEIEDADNAKNDPNVPKDVQINDPLSTAEDSIIDPNVPRDVPINDRNVQINDPLSAAEDSINDPNVPKDVQINDHNVQIKLTERQQTILAILKEDGRVTLEVVSQKLNVATKTVYRDLLRLQELKLVERVGARKKGEWKVL